MTFVKNAWYVVARSDEVSLTPIARTILNIPIVLFRINEHKPVALLDVCPHRAVPLSMGTVEGARIRCAYHALEFDDMGVCRHNPHIKGDPTALRTRSFTVVERYGCLWIWPGDADPDLTKIPHYPEFEQAGGYATGGGYTWVNASYLLMIDNLFDLSHAEYLHPTSVGVPGASKYANYRVVREAGTVKLHYDIPNVPPPHVWHAAWKRSERIDQHAYMHWTGGGNVFLSLCITPAGHSPSDGWNLPFLHLLTPETEKTTHYFWFFARDFYLDDPDLTGAIATVSKQAFEYEDKPVLEAAQRSLDMTGAKLRNFTHGDAASASIRRAISDAAKTENSTP